MLWNTSVLSAVGEEHYTIFSMEGVRDLLMNIATEWSNSECREAVEAAALLKDVLETTHVDKGWDDPEGIRCSPPDISCVGDDSDDAGTARIVKMVR